MPTGICRRTEGRSFERWLTMQIAATARANLYFFAVEDLRAAGAALPKATPQTATDRPPRSALIPRSHSLSRPRSRSPPSDRPFAALGGRDASAAATSNASDSCPDARGSRREGCGPMLLRPRRVPPHTGSDRGLPPAALPIAALSLRGGDGCYCSRRPLRHSCTRPSRAQGPPPAPELPRGVTGCLGRSWRDGRPLHAGSTAGQGRPEAV